MNCFWKVFGTEAREVISRARTRTWHGLPACITPQYSAYSSLRDRVITTRKKYVCVFPSRTSYQHREMLRGSGALEQQCSARVLSSHFSCTTVNLPDAETAVIKAISHSLLSVGSSKPKFLDKSKMCLGVLILSEH